MVVILFAMAFVLGPALFLALLRLEVPPGALMVVASFLVVLSFVLRSEARLTLEFDPVVVLSSVVLIWLAWVSLMVLVAQALFAAVASRPARRAVRAICAMGTTVPWFGFATARMMEGS